MADIDTVLERLVSDTAFRDRLAADPAAALAGYDLSAADLELLAGSLVEGDTAQRGVEQRTSKSAVLGLLASFAGGGGRGGTPPPLDGGSKDSAGFEQLAPPEDDARTIKHPGKVKMGDITLMRGSSSGGDPADLAPADEDAGAAARLPGKPKPGEITLTRTAEPGAGEAEGWIKTGPELLGTSDASAGKGGSIVVMDPTNAAPGGAADPGEQAATFKQGFPIKWQGADVSGDAAVLDPDAAPGGVTGPGEQATAFKQGFPVKWQGASVSGEDGADLDPNAAPDDGAEAGTAGAFPKKLEFGQMKAGDTSVAERTSTEDGGDFLTIEDA